MTRGTPYAQIPRHTQPGARGFSLLETLVALAILSVSALLIFQFVGQQFSLTARVERVSSVSLARAMERVRFTEVVAGVVPAWPETPSEAFVGNPARFSGLSSGQLESVAPVLSPVTMEIVREVVGAGSRLVYRSGAVSFDVARFSQPAAFAYMSQDGAWLPDWPPKVTPEVGQFADAQYYKPRPLPVAVRIQVEGGVELDWVAAMDWQSYHLFRRQDLELD